MNRIVHRLHLGAPPSDGYEALATTDGLSNWWTTDMQGQASAGGVVRFRFLEGFNPEMDVIAARESEHVCWRCISGNELWRGSTLSFDLRRAEEGTELLFEHEYAQDLETRAFGEFNYNWAYYLRSLKQYCERGTGMPFDPGGR